VTINGMGLVNVTEEMRFQTLEIVYFP